MATIKDISRMTGLSIATISKYINGGSLREKNRISIKKAIAELEYETNEIARGLKTNRTMTVGVLLPQIDNLFSTTIISSIQMVLSNYGYSTLICACGDDPSKEAAQMDFLLRKKVDGILYQPMGADKKPLMTVLKRKVPVVQIDRMVDGVDCDSVVIDNEKSGYKATAHLIEMGHTRIGIIAGDQHVFTARLRLQGYQAALKENNILPDERYCAVCNMRVEGGYQAFCELMGSKQAPTAVFATNYEMTLGALIAANERGLRIGEDFSIVGYDDMIMLRLVQPPLTVISQPIEQIAERAAKLLLDRMSKYEEDTHEVVILNTRLNVRQSVKKLNT